MSTFNQIITNVSALRKHLSEYDINMTDECGNNILLHYLQSEDPTKIKFMIFFSIIVGIDLQHSNYQNDTAVSIIINMRTVYPLEVMCSNQECNLHYPNGNGVSPIFLILYYLLEIKESSHPRKKKSKTQLTEIDFLRQMLILLANHPSFVNCKDDLDTNGNSVLHYAVSYGCTKIIRTLLRNGCDINIVNPNSYETPLFRLSYNKLDDSNLSLANILCEYGADVNYVNENGDSVLHLMLIENQQVFLDFQLSKWCLLFMQFGHLLLPNRQGDTPLHIAVIFEMYNVLKQIFKSAHIDTINFKNNMGHSALELLTDNWYNHQRFEILTLFLRCANLDISCLFDVISENYTLTSRIIRLVQSGDFTMTHISIKCNRYPVEIGRILLQQFYTGEELDVAGRLFNHMLCSRRFEYIDMVKRLNLPMAMIRIIIFYIIHRFDYLEVNMLYLKL